MMALLARSGPAKPSTFILADGSTRKAIPIGIHLDMAGTSRSRPTLKAGSDASLA
jgi:hypothetical protein